MSEVSPYFHITVEMYGEACAARARDADRLRFLDEQNKALGEKLLDAQTEAIELRAKVNRLEQLGAEEASKRSALIYRAAQAETPIRELYEAAAALFPLRRRLLPKEVAAARTRLSAALVAAEPHIDLIPF